MGGEIFAQSGGEVGAQQRQEGWVIGQVALADGLIQPELGEGQQRGGLGPGEAFVFGGAEGDGGVIRQAGLGAVEQFCLFQPGHQRGLGGQCARARRHFERDGQGLQRIIHQHQRRHIIGHALEQGVALGAGHAALGLHIGQEDFDVHLMVRGGDAGGIVQRIGVDPQALAIGAELGGLDPPGLGDAEIGALAHHPGADFGAIDADGVIGAVARIGLGFGARFDVGADAAEIQQIGLHPQDGLHDGGGFVPRAGQAQYGLGFGAEGDGFGRAREDAAAGRDQPCIVIRPGGAGQGEEPGAFIIGCLGRGGVEENVAVVEGRLQAGLPCD